MTGNPLEVPGVDLALWGKRRGLPGPYPVVCHLLDAAAAMGVLWDLYVSPAGRRHIAAGLGVDDERARRVLMFWAALHDIGKVTFTFQALADDAFPELVGYPDVPRERIRHDQAVHQWLGPALRQVGYRARSLRDEAFMVAQLLGGHHGRFFELKRDMSDPLVYFPSLGGGKWEQQRQALLGAVHSVLGEPEPPEKRMDADVAGLVCGLVVLADWLVSQDFFVKGRLKARPNANDAASLKAHLVESTRQVPGLLKEAGLGRLRLQPGTFEDEFPFNPNYLQRSLADALPALVGERPGLLLITAPMGDGKTEIALHSARVMGEACGVPGIFVGLPTMATADQIYERVMEYGLRRAIDPAPLTLLHSMAWLNPVYSRDVPPSGEPDAEILTGEGARGAWTAATDWLQARNRGVLAPFSVGTIDQALLAALCGKHNMLRMMGLSGKVIIIDEVHAYDAYMQGLLRRLLTWLGRLGVPVVLLSATLPRQIGHRLVEAYLLGAGHRSPIEVTAGYPGWLYADAGSGRVTSRALDTESRSLDVELHEVPIGKDGRAERSSFLRELLKPLVETNSGCVGIICNTVAEAQQTFEDLQDWLGKSFADGTRRPQLQLLHSRFPAEERAEITRTVVESFGKMGKASGKRPTTAAILVATQVVEQSIDLDFDFLISDLAPIALLLQRAGRCWRHPHNPRPSWVSRARLAVLSPVSAGGRPAVPDSWPFVYPAALLRRTREELAKLATAPIRIPDDVQPLVDAVYDEDFLDPNSQMADDDVERIADEQVKTFISQQVTIPEPADVTSLHALTSSDIDEEVIRTRLGADSARIICCYQAPSGRLFLDPSLRDELPVRGSLDKGRFTKAEVRMLLARMIPVPAAWVRGPDPKDPHLVAWRENAHLRDVLLLRHPVDGDGRIRPAEFGNNSFVLSPQLGLVRLACR
ncbi:CRISPR-associated Cas3 family helicase [Actinomadura pelletieri DSM 43383]|uniref:CRISPR-associated Cas3 family helicase n=1 Tax=Actinomadura pelletieri DSM 43383 TaxID=1120940 RepID=A0A495Q9C8_9ACTN|nr:CRISPR-associated helicase Cas3' [Actinomadura pelletieri]RKS68100.1 CRISPR-associated Cas3 family helicase [Actinomadura pelletieri DSM 43383]